MAEIRPEAEAYYNQFLLILLCNIVNNNGLNQVL